MQAREEEEGVTTTRGEREEGAVGHEEEGKRTAADKKRTGGILERSIPI